MSSRKTRIDATGASWLIGFSVVLGLNQAMIKIVNDGLAPVFQSGLRSLFAVPLVLGFALVMRRKLSLTDGSLPFGIINGLFFSAEFCLLFLALDYTTVARVSLFFYTMPVWVALGAHFLVPGERLHRNKALGLVVAIVGVGMGLSGDLGTAGEDAWIGDLMALAGGMFWAGIALLTRTRLGMCSAEMNLLYQLVVSSIVLLLVSPLFGDLVRDMNVTIGLVLGAQVVVVVAVGYLVWFWILSIYPVSNMASFGLLTPIFGVFFGWLMFDDPLTPAFVLAIVLVSSGVLLVNREPRTAATGSQA